MKERGDLIVENQQPNIKTREEACRWAGTFASYTTTTRGTIPSYPTLEEYRTWLSGQADQNI